MPVPDPHQRAPGHPRGAPPLPHVRVQGPRRCSTSCAARTSSRAQEILAATPREAASVIAKVLASAIANAVNNDGQVADELFITSAFADEGATMKRFRPRARGRAARIRKRSCHVTIIVARMDEDQLDRARATRTTDGASRSRRVAGSRRRADQQSHAHRREVVREEAAAAAEETAAEEAAAAAAVEGTAPMPS